MKQDHAIEVDKLKNDFNNERQIHGQQKLQLENQVKQLKSKLGDAERECDDKVR